MRNKWWR